MNKPTHLLIPIADIDNGNVKIICSKLYSPKTVSLNEDDIKGKSISDCNYGQKNSIQWMQGYRQALKNLLK